MALPPSIGPPFKLVLPVSLLQEQGQWPNCLIVAGYIHRQAVKRTCQPAEATFGHWVELHEVYKLHIIKSTQRNREEEKNAKRFQVVHNER